MNRLNNIKAVIFDWGRTLYDSDAKKKFVESQAILGELKKRGLRLACVSLVTPHASANLEERTNQIEKSSLRKYFEVALVTETDKDQLYEQVVKLLDLPREQVLIVDDRTIRGIKYGNKHGHPTIWLKKGKFANELPNEETGQPTYTISNLAALKEIL